MEDDILLAVTSCIIAKKYISKKRVLNKTWCKAWLLKRKSLPHVNLLSELKLVPKDWHNYLRMDHETYYRLFMLVTLLIIKKDTVMREAISPHERLTATLRFLATGRSYADLKYSTITSPQALSYIIPETCAAIYQVLHQDYLKFPRTEEEWKNIANGFERKWNFPHCIGAMDGKHISIVPPPNSGSEYYNYKGRHSMVLLAIANANYEFILCDFGTNGRVSDGGVLRNTKFFAKLERDRLNIPHDDFVRNSATSMPYVFVCDDAFPLRRDMMKPFRQAQLITQPRKVYNYRLSRARRIVENVFGILTARFRIFHTAINLKPENIDSVVMACCALHNFLMASVPTHYAPSECFDNENTEEGTTAAGYDSGSNMFGLEHNSLGNIPALAKNVRDDYANYFVNEGQVPWQMHFI